ncbi:hypothetical protein BAE44_0000150 [Dichanthelium oligosanthes]|uniref:EF-hand domain-containing protein n=1 Tax=Dichanthelium oligosanthes TaxID=888268 RepID=A0A1E5WNU7_9POAL|nr:hypothetical protein BAE44_0000150 [Dichanthelium oligosanthes]
MTLEEFKEWLKKFDADGDGRISRNELLEALRCRDGWFTTWRSSRALRQADKNNSGFLDDSEIKNLVRFVQKDVGMKISTWTTQLASQYHRLARAPASMAMAAVPPRCVQFPGKEHRTAITAEEFKLWLKQFDTDHDGRISRKELREAIRRRGAWFSGLRARFAVRRADRNHDGFVDDSEIEGLIQFAEREMGFRITATDAAAAVPPPRRRFVHRQDHFHGHAAAVI